MENVFNIKYDTKLDKLEMAKGDKIQRIFKCIKRNKFISFICTSFILFSCVNFYLIFSFMKILENI